MVSVVVPVFNAAHVLAKTVPHQLAEPAGEWVYVDDGSTDGSGDVLERLVAEHANGQSVRVLRHPSNRGRAAARTTGVEASTGDVLLFWDADVAPEPGYLRAVERALALPDAVAAVGRVRVAEPGRGDPYHRYLNHPRRGAQRLGAGRPVPWRFLLLGIGAVRRGAFDAAGGLDASIGYGEDLELGLRLGQRFPEGLRFAEGATGRLYDVGDLEAAIAKMRVFARDDVPALLMRHPEMARELGLDAVVSGRRAPTWRQRLARAALAPPVPALVRGALPLAPPPLDRLAVRYLLGHALAAGYAASPNP